MCDKKTMPSQGHILVVLGTRPEAIKLAPVILALRETPWKTTVCATAQHRELLDGVLDVFGIRPDIDLDLMTDDQELNTLTARILGRMRNVLAETDPDLVIVQGDTTTAMAATLAAHHAAVPVAHVEAGLRTGSLDDPWPEEANRRIIGRIAALHFAPTEGARDNLLAENVDPESVVVTGNTGIDALQLVEPVDPGFDERTVLVTCHRRENQRDGYHAISRVFRRLADTFESSRFVFPVHPSPRVRQAFTEALGERPNVALVEPFDYPRMLGAIRDAHAVITDSGGVQEEAAWFGTPCLVVRPHTDRPESVEAGGAFVVGREPDAAVATLRTLEDPPAYRRAARELAVFGEGDAAARIVEALSARDISERFSRNG